VNAPPPSGPAWPSLAIEPSGAGSLTMTPSPGDVVPQARSGCPGTWARSPARAAGSACAATGTVASKAGGAACDPADRGGRHGVPAGAALAGHGGPAGSLPAAGARPLPWPGAARLLPRGVPGVGLLLAAPHKGVVVNVQYLLVKALERLDNHWKVHRRA